MKQIKQLRKLTGLTQTELARLVGVTQSYLAEVESDKRKPSDELKEKIRDVALIRLLTPVRQMMSRDRREQESRETGEKLAKLAQEFGRDELRRRRVLTLVIDDPKVNPTVVSGEFALSVCKGALNLDLVLLDYYTLDNVDLDNIVGSD